MHIHDRPFIGSEALAAGAVRKHELRSHYRNVFPDVYLHADAELTLRLRATAGWLWSHREGVLAGRTASALHGAKWVDDDAPIELVWPNARRPRGLRTYDYRLRDGEYVELDRMQVTSIGRTAFDLGRHGRLNDAVAHLDALGNATGFTADDVLKIAAGHPGARGLRQLATAVDLYDPGAESPRETWLRLVLIRAGFPRPQTQIPVLGPDGWPLYFLDMGWEHKMLAVEYDGDHHRERVRWGKDIIRSEYIASRHWTRIRVVAGTSEAAVVERVRRAWDLKLR